MQHEKLVVAMYVVFKIVYERIVCDLLALMFLAADGQTLTLVFFSSEFDCNLASKWRRSLL